MAKVEKIILIRILTAYLSFNSKLYESQKEAVL